MNKMKKKEMTDNVGVGTRFSASGARGFLPEGAARKGAPVAVDDTVPDRLMAQGHLSPMAHSAAIRLRRDFFLAGLTPQVTGRYDPLCLCSCAYNAAYNRSPVQERAYTRWRGALKAVGRNVSGLVESAVCYDCRPADRHLMILEIGLERLAKYYALNEEIHQAAARHGLLRVVSRERLR